MIDLDYDKEYKLTPEEFALVEDRFRAFFFRRKEERLVKIGHPMGKQILEKILAHR